MKRAWLSVGLSALALGLGVVTARLAAENRARGDDLDRRHQGSDTLERRNELLCVENECLEWRILHGDDPGAPAGDARGRQRAGGLASTHAPSTDVSGAADPRVAN